MMKNLICIYVSLLFLFAIHAYGFQSSEENFKYPDYYQLHAQASAVDINLLNMIHVRSAFPQPSERYDRLKHFGTWIRPLRDNECLDTRGLVLERDAIHHAIQTNRQCRVSAGTWLDPYTGQSLRSPQLVQIDHMVPLKNAYMTGASEWSYGRRCLYANYMGNKFHLLSVSGSENQSKSDRAPDSYVPPNKKFVCKYLKYWLEVKLIWNLKITPKERRGILKTIRAENCRIQDFKIQYTEYQEQQNYIRENVNLCRN